MYTSAKLKALMDKMIADNDKKIEALRDELKLVEERKGNTADVQRRLSDALAAARASEDLAERNYNAQLQRETSQRQAQEKQNQAVAAELDAKNKARARRDFERAGGDPAKFEQQWPAIRDEMIKQSVIQAAQKPEPARTSVGINQGF